MERTKDTAQSLRNSAGFAGFSTGQSELMVIIPELENALELFLGKPVKPSPARAVGEFGLLPEARQTQVNQGLKLQLDFIREATRLGLDAYNEVSLVRLAMKKLGMMADENTIEKVDPSDVVEIVAADHTQVYRSYSCFALCNYSVAELVTFPWYELYERPAWVESRILELCQPVFEGKVSYISLEGKIPPYILKETQTDECEAFEVTEKAYSLVVSHLSRSRYVLSTKKIVSLGRAGGERLAFL